LQSCEGTTYSQSYRTLGDYLAGVDHRGLRRQQRQGAGDGEMRSGGCSPARQAEAKGPRGRPALGLGLAVLVLAHEAADPVERDLHGVVVHVGVADAEPAGLVAVERRAGRHVELHPVYDGPPQLQLRVVRPLPEHAPQVHPREEARVARQARDADLAEARDEAVVARRQPPRALREEAGHELRVGEHPRQEVLRLRRDEAEAGHLARAGHHVVVVGVDDADAEAREAEVLGEAVRDVDEVPVAARGVALDDLGDAHEARLGEDGARVDLVADEVDAALRGERGEHRQRAAVHGGAQRVGGVGDEDAPDADALPPRAVVGRHERLPGEGEVVRAVAFDGQQLHS
jgi:hypothetical protein